jgi:hypothetical protein
VQDAGFVNLYAANGAAVRECARMFPRLVGHAGDGWARVCRGK